MEQPDVNFRLRDVKLLRHATRAVLKQGIMPRENNFAHDGMISTLAKKANGFFHFLEEILLRGTVSIRFNFAMHVTRSIDTDKRIAIATVTGEITVAEVRADMARLATKPGNVPDMPGIVDMRGATAGLTSDELRQIAEVIKNSPKAVNGARRALLVGSDLMYGLYRMFAAFASDGTTEFRVFRDEKLAWAWIGEIAEDEENRADDSFSSR